MKWLHEGLRKPAHIWQWALLVELFSLLHLIASFAWSMVIPGTIAHGGVR